MRTMVFQCDSTNPLDNCHLAEAGTTLDWLLMRYSLIVVPNTEEFDVTIAVDAPGERAGGTAKESDC